MRKIAALLTRKRLTLWGVALLLLSWSLSLRPTTLLVSDAAESSKGTDYIYFYVMGSLVLEGRIDALYDSGAHLAEGRRRIDPDLTLYAGHSNYGPQVALAFAPLAVLPFAQSLSLFLALSSLSYGIAVWVLWRESPALRQHPGVVAILALASPAFLTSLRYAQLSAFSLLLWALAFLAFRRRYAFMGGVMVGCLAFKPQFGIVIAVVLIAAREWRAVAGAIAAVLGQLTIGWLVAGSAAMTEYWRELWILLQDSELVNLNPSEAHSIRGLFQFWISSKPILTGISVIAVAAACAVAVRCWISRESLGLRWGQVVLLTILASPHLLTYDLLLLAIPLILFAEWALLNQGHPLRPAISLLLVPLYLAPFSSNLARLIQVQLSVPTMAVLACCVYYVCTKKPMGYAVRTPITDG